MVDMENLNAASIFNYIQTTYKNSCLASNSTGLVVYDVENESYYIEECLEFFHFEVLKLCDCGNPKQVYIVVRDILNTLSLEFKEKEKKQAEIGIQGLIHFVLYTLDEVGILEHGGSIFGAWLTDLGKMYLWLLNNANLLEE